ncbi:MAG: hypothetical protein HY903_01225 [Deltaproteobacteria bacterium]|nr:hypothetical protein [Deltaproteobacteria bacterium]
MRRLCLALATLAGFGCGQKTPRNVRLDLVLRSSCPASTQSYDISCVHSVVVGLVATTGQSFESRCTAVSGSYASLQDLLAATHVVSVLEKVEARADVRLAVRAYHGGDKPPCHDLLDSELMFWGMSPAADLTDPAVDELVVEVECRPECDCADLGATERCPSDLVIGICAPPANRPCRKQCNDNGDCYDGLLSCEVGTCDDLPASGQCCTATDGERCWECGRAGDCNSGVCVHNTYTVPGTTPPEGPDEWFCASPCPPLPNVTPCPTGMSCKRLDNGIYVSVP